MENLSGSRGSLIVEINFSGSAQVVWSSSNRGVVEFFLLAVDSRPIGSRRELARASSQEDYVSRIAPAARNGFRGFGSRRAHRYGIILSGGSVLRRVLSIDAICSGSLRSQKKVLARRLLSQQKKSARGILRMR